MQRPALQSGDAGGEVQRLLHRGHCSNSPIEDALPVLEDIPQVRQKLQTLVDVGLGYIHLGQSATTLSGGEAQRMKLARELSKRQTGKTLYLLDEPTTGLHFDDVRKLLEVLHRLTDLGNTVIIIEHNLDVIRNADWIIDLGPEGGEEGGMIVAKARRRRWRGLPARIRQSFCAGISRKASLTTAPWHPVARQRRVVRQSNGAVHDGRARRRLFCYSPRNSKQIMPIDPSSLPPAASPEDALRPTRRLCPSPPWKGRRFAAATPHIGHTLLFGLLVGACRLPGRACLRAVVKHVAPHLHESVEQMQTDPRLVIPVEAVIYAIAAAASFLIFPLFWGALSARPCTGAHLSRVDAGGCWLASAWRPASSCSCFRTSCRFPRSCRSIISSPNRLGVWLIAIFGVTVAPAFEELAFRGFLLPSLASAWDWVMQRARTHA